MWNRNLGVGIFAIVGTVLFAVIIFLIGNQHSAFAKHIELFAVFKNLDGLAKGAQVQVAGFDAGEVADISVPASPSTGFRLKLRLNDQVRGLVRTDSVATIATEGVVGDKVVIILPGSSASKEAAPFSTLPTKNTSDMAELIQKSTALVSNASTTMKTVGDKLTTTLDALTTTANNANNLVVGLNQGRGTIGMLLRDEKLAADIRQTLANAHQASSSLSHASGQADDLISDFQSRELPRKVDAIVSDIQARNIGEKLDNTMQNVQSATHNIDATAQQLHETIAKAFAPDTHGVDAGDNIRQSLSNLNQATGNMAEDTEALKHQFFFRGFFRQRGYFSMARLAPDKYREDKVFANPKNQRVWIEAGELFESKQGEVEALSPAGKMRIDAAVAELGDRLVGGAVVVEGYAISGAPSDQLAVSRGRAILVRDYLRTRFQLDNNKVGLIPLRGVPPPATQKNSWNGVCIMLLTRSSG
jgi:phospholipid/cholesterol/gamma-HCH transport system substrate-binding protein